jgi:hypothetical protein
MIKKATDDDVRQFIEIVLALRSAVSENDMASAMAAAGSKLSHEEVLQMMGLSLGLAAGIARGTKIPVEQVFSEFRRMLMLPMPVLKDIAPPSVAAIIDHVDEEPPPEGATCTRPDRAAFIDACQKANAAGPGHGVSEDGLPKCGKLAVVSLTYHFKNGPKKHDLYCEDCRPRRLPEVPVPGRGKLRALK